MSKFGPVIKVVNWAWKNKRGIISAGEAIGILIKGTDKMTGGGVKRLSAKVWYKVTGIKTKIYEQMEKEAAAEAEKEDPKQGANVNVVNAPNNPKKTTITPTDAIIIDEWIEAGDMVYIVAPSGVGKSTLAYSLACAMARGEATVLNPEVPALKHQVLYYQLDMREASVRKNYPHLVDYFPMLECVVVSGGIDCDNLVEEIRERIKKTKDAFVTVFIDNLNRVKMKGRLHEEMERLREEVKETDNKILTTVILNHTSTDYDNKRSYMPIRMSDAEGFKDDPRNCDAFIALNNTCMGEGYVMISQVKRRTGKTKKEVIVVGREPNPHLHFEYLDEACQEDMLPLKKTYGREIPENRTLQQELAEKKAKKSRGESLKLTPEQKAKIVEIYHACGDNYAETARRVNASNDELLRAINNYAPMQVKRIVDKFEKEPQTVVPV